ncbi:hypothetical protein [Spirillospora sp. CA-294931]|uniref:hypothetical protein n=1 Tax=Spirillospora sp. CA-294931 TaxID=3240042 RepID=UPI003D9449C2
MKGISKTGPAPIGRWTLDFRGHRLEVETERGQWHRAARLYVDGDLTEEDAKVQHQAKLPYGDLKVVVAFDALGLLDGQAARCALEIPPPDPKAAEGKVSLIKEDDWRSRVKSKLIPFDPPEGTRAEKRERLAARHPGLYASRHVALAVGKVLFPLLGLGLLVKLLLDMIPKPDLDIDPPSLPIPDIPLPDLDIPWPDVSVPGWLAVILATAKFWIPILIAIGMAKNEYDRRKKQQRAKAAEAEQDNEKETEPVSR